MLINNHGIRYPIYIISKGRYQNPLTAKAFLKEGIFFRIAVEPQEYNQYCAALGSQHVIKLPFSNLGLGSYPARNYCWEHSIQLGFKKHFLFDDNIRGFIRFDCGKRDKCSAITALKSLENFTDRFINVAISGFNYRYFVIREKKQPVSFNTHVYSGMLINNCIPYRWRLKYNEDVDLCLNALHNKWCTILVSAFLIDKVSTVTKMKGGNQDELYLNNDHGKKMLKSRSLQVIWPQYVKVIERFGRPHHSVSWRKFFKHPLIKRTT